MIRRGSSQLFEPALDLNNVTRASLLFLVVVGFFFFPVIMYKTDVIRLCGDSEDSKYVKKKQNKTEESVTSHRKLPWISPEEIY